VLQPELLERYLLHLLNPNRLDLGRIDPKMPHGLCFKGSDHVGKLGFGVHGSVALFKCAVERGCTSVVVHEGPLKSPCGGAIDGVHRGRRAFLSSASMNLFTFHYLLDAHPTLGNNARIIAAVGAELKRPLLFRGVPWGWCGRLGHPTKLEVLADRLGSVLGIEPVVFGFGPRMIQSFAVLSGSGAIRYDMIGQLRGEVELYISGELEISTQPICDELGLNYMALGHEPSERLGLLALMERVHADHQGLECEFLADPFLPSTGDVHVHRSPENLGAAAGPLGAENRK
jgi:putative NIF3 family GTP cyclohydrolase 1 type 2